MEHIKTTLWGQKHTKRILFVKQVQICRAVNMATRRY